MTATSTKRRKAFISYSRDSEADLKRVRQLATRLGKAGIDCSLDQYEVSPPDGWLKWMDDQISQNDFVIIIYTEAYASKARGEGPSGKGVAWEHQSIHQALYENHGKNDRFIPVVFQPSDVSYIPTHLKDATYFDQSTRPGRTALISHLTGQRKVIKPSMGPVHRGASSIIRNANVAASVAGFHNGGTVLPLIGREKDVRALKQWLLDPDKRLVTLTGPGGIGKSTSPIT